MDTVNNTDKKKPEFKSIPLELYKPEWDDKLTGIILELETLRSKRLGGQVNPHIFFQLKDIFQLFESLGSARIEGNRTTLTELVEKVIDERVAKKTQDQRFREIDNIEKAIAFIDKNIHQGAEITQVHLSEIHKIIVQDLTPAPEGEGSRSPGEYRTIPVYIAKSDHVPPPNLTLIEKYMDELLKFINKPVESKNNLLVTAIAHHRMAWIHPYDNGNGRMVRMLTYAMLIKQGFAVKRGRILNPTAIFCIDRDSYYKMLALADSGDRSKTLEWCTYVLSGLRTEIEKIDHLLDYEYMIDKILLPTIDFALDRKHITQREYAILHTTILSENMEIKAGGIEKITGAGSPVQRSRIIKSLRDKGMLIPLRSNGRIYTIGFANSFLLRGVVETLKKCGFIPESMEKN